MEKTTLRDIIKNGGATLNGSTLEKVLYKNGFQVSKKDCFIIDANDAEAIIAAVESLRGSADNIGIWIDGNKAYIDISERIEEYNDAMRAGIEADEQTKEDISDALYQLLAICENRFNKDYYRTLYKTLETVTEQKIYKNIINKNEEE